MTYFGAYYFLTFLYFINSLFYIWQYKQPVRFYFGLVLFLMSLLSLIESMFYSGALKYFPYLLGSSPMFTAFTIIFFGLYLIYVKVGKKKWKAIVWVSFLYPLHELIVYIIFLVNNWHSIPHLYVHLHTNGNPLFFLYPVSYYLELIMGIIMYSGVVVYCFTTFSPTEQDKKTRKKLWIMVISLATFSVILLFIHVFNFLYYGFGNHHGIYNKFPIYFIIWLALVYLQIWPFYYKSGQVDFDVQTFLVPSWDRYLDPENKEKIETNLKALVQENEFYKDDEISLSKLASLTGVSAHQLSEYLNKHENKNFSHYINYLRIQEAMRLLSGADRSIIEICYEIGYNTSATFYKAFKSITGFTPKEWRQNNLKS